MVPELQKGYLAFRKDLWPQHKPLYRRLGKDGQKPRVMVLACCDSRVDPAVIFSADPGDLFVARNIANVVPPYEPDMHHHGTSAALEFAVRNLGVRHVLVLGHAKCGGIAACLDDGLDPDTSFIGRWISLLDEARAQVLGEHCPGSAEAQTALEQRAICASLENLRSFPFVAERLKAGRLALHGAWFDIDTGRLLWLDDSRGVFCSVEATP